MASRPAKAPAVRSSLQLAGVPVWILAGAGAVAAALKAGLLAWDAFPFDADEAVVGLMARHILEGGRPVFFYGQAYMGSLDAALVALGFSVFGPKVDVIRWVQIGLYVGTTVSVVILAQRVTGSTWTAGAAGLLMAVPTVNVTLYTTVSLGGYGEALLLGQTILLSAIAVRAAPASIARYLVWGFLAGLGFWAFGLTLIYSVPSAILVIGAARRHGPAAALLAAAGGAAVGVLPVLVWVAENGVAPLARELLGQAIAGASASAPLVSILEHLRNLSLLGTTVILGLRPPWDVRPLALPLAPLAAVVWVLIGWSAARSAVRRLARVPEQAMLLGVGVALLAGFVFTPFGADPSGRYFVPLAALLAVLAADRFDAWRLEGRKSWAYAGLLVLLAFHLWSNLQAAALNPPGITTQFNPESRVDHRYDQELIAFLRREGELRGYSTYWVAYPLAFLTAEELVYIPRLPYHVDFRFTARDDRYAPYTRQVAASPRVAYIAAHHPALAQRIRSGLRAAQVEFAEHRVGDYVVFYRLSRPITPAALGLYAVEAPG